MFKNVNGTICSIIVAAAAATLPSSVSANDIALTLKDHALTVVGDYVGFENNAYIINTVHGEMTIPAGMATCVGDACIAVATIFTVSG